MDSPADLMAAITYAEGVYNWSSPSRITLAAWRGTLGSHSHSSVPDSIVPQLDE
jgi:hypothetical protein